MDPALEPLIAALEGNPDANVRVQAAYDIGQAGLWEGVEYLKRALEKDDASLVRVAALISLHQIMGEDVLEIAKNCAEKSPERDVRFTAVEILGALANNQALDLLESLLEKEQDLTVKEMITLVIARKGDKKSKPKLTLLLKDPESPPRIKERVVEYFINTGDKDGIPLIRELKNTSHPILRLKALLYLALQNNKEAKSELEQAITEIQSDFVVFVKGQKVRGAEGVKKLLKLA